jgi:hypothetical protein
MLDQIQNSETSTCGERERLPREIRDAIYAGNTNPRKGQNALTQHIKEHGC